MEEHASGEDQDVFVVSDMLEITVKVGCLIRETSSLYFNWILTLSVKSYVNNVILLTPFLLKNGHNFRR